MSERERKNWGWVTHIFESDEVGLSLLETEAGQRCSVHLHQARSNAFHVVTGQLCVKTYVVDAAGKPADLTARILDPGEKLCVRSGVWHAFFVLRPGIVTEVYRPDPGPVRRADILRADQGRAFDIEECREQVKRYDAIPPDGA